MNELVKITILLLNLENNRIVIFRKEHQETEDVHIPTTPLIFSSLIISAVFLSIFTHMAMNLPHYVPPDLATVHLHSISPMFSHVMIRCTQG